MTDYTDVIETLVKAEMDTVGRELALKKTHEVPEIDLDKNGEVKEIHGNGKEITNRLLDKYEEVSGPVVVSLLARKLISSIDKDEIDIELPERLDEKVSAV